MALCVSSPGSRDQWNTILTRLPRPHFLQTWEWAALKSRHGWDPARIVWTGCEKNEPLAVASILTRRVGRWPSAVMYTPKGPILDYGSPDLFEQVLEYLEDLATEKRALFIKIDPDVQVNSAEGEAVMVVLRRRGWQFSQEQIQFRNTMLVDLGLDPDELLAAMKSKWRYNTRLAVRKGVAVRRSGLDDLPLLYRMYAETSTRDGFVIRSQASLRWTESPWRWSSYSVAGTRLGTCTGHPGVSIEKRCPIICCSGKLCGGLKGRAARSMICGERQRY